MHEGTPGPEAPSPAEQLAAFQGFLAESAALNSERLYYLMLRQPLLGPEQFAAERAALDTEAAADLYAGLEHIGWLMNNGIFIFVRHADGSVLPLEGLKFDIGDPHYSMAIETDDGHLTWPLDDTCELFVHLRPSPIATATSVTLTADPLPSKVLPL